MQDETSATKPLVCHRCGYDLRATPDDGVCPECGGSVAESRRLAKIPVRPAWRDSDPRWRRRMLLGVWLLAIYPWITAALYNVLHGGLLADLFDDVQVPVLFMVGETWQPITQSHLMMVEHYPLFVIGVVLLFSRERGRRQRRLDWTRRWGVLGSYAVAVFGFASAMTVTGLVLLGIAALLNTIPLDFQPVGTGAFVELAIMSVEAMPQLETDLDVAVLAMLSSLTMLLACVSLFNGLRSIRRDRDLWTAPAVCLVPLALVCLGQLCWVVYHWTAGTLRTSGVFGLLYFFDRDIIGLLVDDPLFAIRWRAPSLMLDTVAEISKFLSFFTIATCLSVSQIRSKFAKRARLGDPA